MLINCAALKCVADDAEHNMHTYTYVHTHRNAHVHVSYTHISTHTYPNKCAYYIFQIRKHELHRFIFLVTYVQITSAVLRDPSGCDALADQVLSSLQSRYADGVDSSREINEVIGMHNFFCYPVHHPFIHSLPHSLPSSLPFQSDCLYIENSDGLHGISWKIDCPPPEAMKNPYVPYPPFIFIGIIIIGVFLSDLKLGLE